MAELLSAASQIPIAQLTPELSAPSARYIRAIVTLIWPYSSSNSTFKVLLAEPDFRLRRTNGQVRVHFSESSAKAVFEAGIGSGDEFILSLDGVEWTKDESVGQTPGRSIDWELKFSERLVLKIQQNGSEKSSLLDVDHPIPRPQSEVSCDIPEIEPIISPPKSTAFNSDRPGLIRSETNEWSSPAFVKRARVSYGSLFESGYDIFSEEDGTVQGRGRKRTRFSRQSGGWRYSSRSQSPEPTLINEEMVDSGPFESEENQKPAMTDEGCQTLESQEDNAAKALAGLSGQYGSTVLSEDISDVHQPGSPSRKESLNTNAVSADMHHPPTPPLALEDEIRGKLISQETTAKDRQISLGSTQIDMAGMESIHVIGPNEPLDQGLDEATEQTVTVEAEDLYGLSPTADGYSRNEDSAPVKDLTGPHLDDKQVGSNFNNQEDQGLLEDPHESISYPKLLDRSELQDEVVDTTAQIYPQSIMEVNHNVDAQSSPLSGVQSQNYPETPVDELHQQSKLHWDKYAEGVESSEDYLIQERIPIQKIPARLFSPAGIAISRSHSGSEMIDLTEDSDENEGEANESLQTDEEEEEETDERKYPDDNLSGEEEEGYERLLYNEDESGPAEMDFRYDEYAIRPPIKELAPGEVADDEEGLDFEGPHLEEEGFDDEDLEETEGEYDEDEDEDEREDTSEEEHVSHAMKQPGRDEPEVIDLLSSDGEDEDEEDVNASTNDLESEEEATVNLDKNPSISAEEHMSEGDVETDTEDLDDEEGEGRESNEEEHPPEIHHNHFKLVRGDTAEDLERSVPGPVSERDEIEVTRRANRELASRNISRSAMKGSKFSQDIGFDRRNKTSATGDRQTFNRGYDGTTDDPDYLLAASCEAEDDGTAAPATDYDISVDQTVEYPILPTVDAIAQDLPLLLDKSAQVGSISIVSKNEQLPTPDATQLTEPMAMDTSFASADSFHSPSARDWPIGSNMNGIGGFPPRKALDTIQKDEELAAVNEFATTSPRDATTNAATETIEIVTGAVIGNTAKDTPLNVAIEVIPENTPKTVTNSSSEVAEKAVIGAVQPGPVTPRRSKRLSFTHQEEIAEISPSFSMREPTTPEDYDASVELAMAGLDSPLTQSPDEHQLSDREMRVKLSRPLRTDFGDFTTLKTIRFNLERKLDVLASVATLPVEPQRAKGGLRHYHLRFNITDATIAPSTIVAVNVFRPYKMALPIVQPGDVILLRNFLVKSDKGAGFALRSDEGSSWVVFKTGGEEQMRGPPVEYGDGERDLAGYMKVWYRDLDSSSIERLERANGVTGSDMERNMSKVF